MFTSKRRKRVITDCSKGDKTDQSFAKASNINTIMQNAMDNKINPYQQPLPTQFVDTTGIPSLEESFEIVQNAMQHFATLPPEIRRLMDNDPSQLESFINDIENNAVLKKHGIIIEDVKKEEKVSEEPSSGGTHDSNPELLK